MRSLHRDSRQFFCSYRQRNPNRQSDQNLTQFVNVLFCLCFVRLKDLMSELESVGGKNDYVLNVRNFFLNYVKKQYPVNAGDIYIYIQ